MNNAPWDGYPPYADKSLFHWLERKEGQQRVPAWWDAEKGVWQAFGENYLRQPHSAAMSFTYIERALTPDEVVKLPKVFMTGR